MNKFSELSDFQVSKLIANYEYPEKIKAVKATKPNVVDVWIPNGVLGFYKHAYVDYCNNWADMGPLSIKNNIVMTPCMGANAGDATAYFEHENPITVGFSCNSKALRAAAEVYLMIKDAEQC